MITINGTQIEKHHFPDGTQRLTNIPFNDFIDSDLVWIDWKYENDEELFTLYCLVRHIRANFADKVKHLDLHLDYIPNARMDRVKSTDEVFTLKYFCEIINLMGFDTVYVLDPHSDVSVALLNNVRVKSFADNFKKVIISIASKNGKNGDTIKDDLVFYAPDAGACKRYSELLAEYVRIGIPFVHGEKKRDWKTGKIEGLDIITNGVDLTGKTVIMIDDIISYGGTFYHSAKELKSRGVNKIYAYATHTEDSLFSDNGTFKKCLEDGTVECLYTTNSLISFEIDETTYNTIEQTQTRPHLAHIKCKYEDVYNELKLLPDIYKGKIINIYGLSDI